MTRAELLSFLRTHPHAVVATNSRGGPPESAVVGYAVTDELELVFDTLDSTRKCWNLRRDPQLSAVIGWEGTVTVQYEGVAGEPVGAELARLQAVYFAAFPDGPNRLSWPGITYFRLRPTWIRYSDFAGATPRIVEQAAADWR